MIIKNNTTTNSKQIPINVTEIINANKEKLNKEKVIYLKNPKTNIANIIYLPMKIINAHQQSNTNTKNIDTFI